MAILLKLKFGECDSWYSSAYIHSNKSLISPTKESINQLWRNSNNDSRHIYGIVNFDNIYSYQVKKIEQVYNKCDVMVTHINPSCLNKHISPRYRNQDTNTFFTFDGSRFMALGNMKYWIFRHTHDAIEYELHGVKCICHPLGYPTENNYDDTMIKSIEI